MRLTSYLRVRYNEVREITKKYANLPESYLKRKMIVEEYRTPRGFPQYRPVTVARKEYHFDENRPWTERFRLENALDKKHQKIFVEPLRDWNFFKGDRVEILEGKDRGKQGHIVQIIAERNWVFVEGLNCTLEKIAEKKNFPGIYFQKEKPLLVPKQVALVDPSDLQPVDIEWRYTEEGERVRVSKRTGRIIPLPVQAEETLDYKTKATYVESPLKDTTEKDLMEVTFTPSLQTFEMEIMKEMDIKEDRVPKPVYWY